MAQLLLGAYAVGDVLEITANVIELGRLVVPRLGVDRKIMPVPDLARNRKTRSFRSPYSRTCRISSCQCPVVLMKVVQQRPARDVGRRMAEEIRRSSLSSRYFSVSGSIRQIISPGASDGKTGIGKIIDRLEVRSGGQERLPILGNRGKRQVRAHLAPAILLETLEAGGPIGNVPDPGIEQLPTSDAGPLWRHAMPLLDALSRPKRPLRKPQCARVLDLILTEVERSGLKVQRRDGPNMV